MQKIINAHVFASKKCAFVGFFFSCRSLQIIAPTIVSLPMQRYGQTVIEHRGVSMDCRDINQCPLRTANQSAAVKDGICRVLIYRSL